LPKALALLLCLALSAAADDCGGRPCLDVWTLDGPNDRAFWTAYETDQAFRDAIDGAFVLRRIPIRQQPLAAITRGIRGGPTFAVPGRQLIYGFRGTDVLLAELGLPRIERSAPEDRQTLPPPQPIDVEELRRSIASDLARTINETEQRLRSATDRKIAEALSRQLDSLSELQRQVQDLQTGSDQTGADRRLLQGIAATVRDLQERRSPPDDAEQPPPSDRLSSPSVSDSALRLFGASVSLTQLLLAGGAIAGAPPAAWLTLAAIKRLRHRGRADQPRDSPRRCRLCAKKDREIESLRAALTAAKTRTKTETRFVTVPEACDEGEAYKEAIRRVGGLQPKSVPVLNQVEAAARQILHGQRVGQKRKEHHESRPGLWSDDR
jgi:hypothetical protein